MAKKSDTFGRDEMTALLGGHVAETSTTLPSSSILSNKSSKTHSTSDEPDVSTLTTAQTAALLKKKDLEKQQKLQLQQQRGTILRAQKRNHVPNRHALLQEEELEMLPFRTNRSDDRRGDGQNDGDWASDQDEDRDFIGKKQERRKIEPQVVVRRDKAEPQVLRKSRKSRRRSDSSSSSDVNDPEPVTRHGRGSEDGSSDDNEEDTRRQRLLARRRQLARETKVDVDTSEMRHVDNETVPNETTKSAAPASSIRNEHKRGALGSSDSSSNGDGDSSDGTSSSSGDDSSDDEAPVMAKPIFVPRHKRNTIVSQDQKTKEEEHRDAKNREEEKKRKMESRMLVAEVVAAASATPEQVDDDEGGGATNAMPDDSDPVDPIEMEKERDAWEVRELERLFNAQDSVDLKRAEKAEYERRRSMTDEERLLEDEALGLYRRPGEHRKETEVSANQGNFMQRYYHRGAFYMDDNEWSTDDVRHKAKEYESAVTGNDKIDKSSLPKVMQVKNFGFARQNTKYKGLAHEDTTDKGTHFLPLAPSKRQRR